MAEPEGSPIGQARVETLRAEGARQQAPARDDQLAIEAPLELRLAVAGASERSSTVLMRTPGADEELVRGFLFSEGMIAAREQILSLARPPGLSGDERGNVIAVELAASRALPPPERLFYSSSSCGVCGKATIAQLAVRAQPSRSTLSVSRAVLASLPAALRAAQPLFQATGGVHAAALFDAAGRLDALREDVGRHNALDKLIGWALAAGRLPLTDRLLLVSGRVSYEIMQKAIAAGLPLVAAVGAPSSLAVELAAEFAVTLVGFVRDGSMNVYAHGERIA